MCDGHLIKLAAYNRHANGHTTLAFVNRAGGGRGGEKPALMEGAGWPVELKGMMLSEVVKQRLNKSVKKATKRHAGGQFRDMFKKCLQNIKRNVAFSKSDLKKDVSIKFGKKAKLIVYVQTIVRDYKDPCKYHMAWFVCRDEQASFLNLPSGH